MMTPLRMIGSDALSIRDLALERVGGEHLLRSYACQIILDWAADLVVRTVSNAHARAQFKSLARHQIARSGPFKLSNWHFLCPDAEGVQGPAAILLRHGRDQGRVLAGRFRAISPQNRELLAAALVEMDRVRQRMTEARLEAAMSAALAESEASGNPDEPAALFLRDCCALVRHAHDIWDVHICRVVDTLPSFWGAATASALEHRRRSIAPDDDGRALAEAALRSIGRGGDDPFAFFDDALPGRAKIALRLLECLSWQSSNLPPAKTAVMASFLSHPR